MESEEINSSETSTPEAKNNDLSDFPFDGESTAPLFNRRLHLIPKYVIDRPILEDPTVPVAYEKSSDYAAAWGVAEPSTSKVYEGEPEPKRIVRRRFSINTETVKSTSEKTSSDNGLKLMKTNTDEGKENPQSGYDDNPIFNKFTLEQNLVKGNLKPPSKIEENIPGNSREKMKNLNVSKKCDINEPIEISSDEEDISKVETVATQNVSNFNTENEPIEISSDEEGISKVETVATQNVSNFNTENEPIEISSDEEGISKVETVATQNVSNFNTENEPIEISSDEETFENISNADSKNITGISRLGMHNY